MLKFYRLLDQSTATLNLPVLPLNPLDAPTPPKRSLRPRPYQSVLPSRRIDVPRVDGISIYQFLEPLLDSLVEILLCLSFGHDSDTLLSFVSLQVLQEPCDIDYGTLDAMQR